MTRKEYSECCYALERLSGLTEKRKRERSICLKLMQEIGIDTTDWARVNDFCRHPRIAGKAFAQISIEDLEALSKKLRAIKRAGGLKDKRQTAESTTVYVVATAPNNLKS
jgi:translation initiation factor IF-2